MILVYVTISIMVSTPSVLVYKTQSQIHAVLVYKAQFALIAVNYAVKSHPSRTFSLLPTAFFEVLTAMHGGGIGCMHEFRTLIGCFGYQCNKPN